MDTWLKRAEVFGDVLPGTSLTHVHAGMASDMWEKISHAVKIGLGTAAIMAALNLSGPLWEKMIDKIRTEDPAVIDEEYIKGFIGKEEIPFRLIDDIPEREQEPEQHNLDYDSIAQYIGGHEGSSAIVYNDSYGNPTVGIGHMITGESRGIFNELFGEEVNFDDVVAGTVSLTQPQITTLFSYDVQSRLSTARRLFPQFNSYNVETQGALLDGIYRGDLSGSPNTISLINQGSWDSAATEYLNHQEYIDAKDRLDRGVNTTNAGVVYRMEENAARMRSNN